MQCVILAGGIGTRIRERSGDMPKALIPVLGKPFIFYQLAWLACQAVTRVVLSIGYRGSMIQSAVGNGSQFGLSVAYADEGDALRGTGGALRFIADLGLLEPGFFVLYGDSFLPIDLAPMWRVSEKGRACTMAVLRNRGRWDKSNVVFKDGKIVLYDKFASDQDAADMEYIDYGISVLTRDVILGEIHSDEVADLAKLLNCLSIQGRLKGHEVFERFYEIGSPQGLDDFEAYIRAKDTSGT
jgi:MurNAc alpha-1-phosphate uridylyltransferase